MVAQALLHGNLVILQRCLCSITRLLLAGCEGRTVGRENVWEGSCPEGEMSYTQDGYWSIATLQFHVTVPLWSKALIMIALLVARYCLQSNRYVGRGEGSIWTAICSECLFVVFDMVS